ncbi:MAG TPA: SdrD B-like domain-containing protein [Kiritimatiellia bacterium]|nr:SdrD B-like domain-containing protein [Kiritimatiellia bacterium]HMP35324.1 SdrD B-like domain-containing protein [Kiritimatiellia bacterium]
MNRPSTATLRHIIHGLAASLLLASATHAQSIVQTYFIPFDEDEVNVALNTIDNFSGNIGTTLRSTISIVGGITNTVLYWDHWEDGYEANIMAPTQATTKVWGDNNPLNGIPPGFSSDRVGEGDIITLTNDIPLPRSGTNIYYDARDRLSVTRWVAMSRYLYAPSPGEVLADSAQIYDRSKFGFEFRVPVGINVGTNEMFEYASLHLGAGYDGTVLSIDGDADGAIDETVHLNAGQNHFVRFVSRGASVTATKPIQAHMITGDIGSNYEMRFFELFPRSQWDTSYFTSVHSVSNIATEVYVYNPNATAITVTCRSLYSTSRIDVAANTTGIFTMPTNSGAVFYTTNGLSFVAISATDAGKAIALNQAYDWGCSLIPVRALTTVSIVPWAPGAGGNPLASRNGNPIWITAESNTTLYIDLDGNSLTGPLTDAYGRRYDYHTNLLALQSIRVSDTNDNDQTGMRIYTLDGVKFATIWGQDPAVALTGNPYLDMGAAVFPFPTVPAVKDWSLETDRNTNGVVNPGDDVKFTIHVVNVGYSDANNVVVYDTGASNTTYLAGSSFVNGTNIVDDSTPPFDTAFPFDEFGYNLGFIPIGHTATVTYVFTVNDPFPTNTDGIVNGVYVDNQTQVFVPVPIPGFMMTKTSTTNLLEPGDRFTYTIDITSTANVQQTGVRVLDELPVGVTYVSNTTRIEVFGAFTGTLADYFTVDDEFNGSDGGLPWLGVWQEIGESNGPGAGDIRVTTDTTAPGDRYMLRIQGGNRGAMRQADLSAFTNITLAFRYRRDSMEAGDTVSASVSSNGGVSWTILTNLSGSAFDGTYSAATNLNASAFRSTNFALRFLGNSTMDTNDRVWIDDVIITTTGLNPTNRGGPPPTLAANYIIASGQTMRITFDVTIDGAIATSNIINRAFVSSHAASSPLEAAATNTVLLPARSRIGGWVRNDTEGLGNLNGLFAGIPNVPITLYTDPNRDGFPDDGVLVATAYTGNDGWFELGYFPSNAYVIAQTDLVNFRSTADSDGGHSNLIALVTVSGTDATNHLFLDSQTALIGGQVRFDQDGDGDMADDDEGIGGVVITLYTDPNRDGYEADGVAVSSRVTIASGDFQFARVETGAYVVVAQTISGMGCSMDSDTVNDYRIAVYMPGGLDDTSLVFLYSSSGLSLTKTASPSGIWYNNLQARYVVTVVNTSQFIHTGVNVIDSMSDGLSYIAGSVRLSGQPTNYVTQVYTNAGTNTFSVPAGVTQVEYLVVGGGGGGGGIPSGSYGGGGGGGAGGLLSNIGGAPMAVTPGSNYMVVVGAGGSAGVGGTPGGNGGTSRFHTVYAAGGGGGASSGNNNGRAGGSGGGGRLNTSGLGGTGIAGQGNNGGSGASSGSSAGGGGGASTIGTNGLTGGVGGAGGAGSSNRITGAWVAYAGGGGGGGYGSSGGAGGPGGGGRAPTVRGAGSNAVANTGGGGGGATGSSSGNAFDGGRGGSGIVVIRYAAGVAGPPPTLGQGYTLLPGESLTFAFTAEVFAVSSVTNTACVVSDLATNALCATVINSVDTGSVPNRIGGRVRFDVDGDADPADTDEGIGGVVLHIHTDPNGDGDPTDGERLDSTTTDDRGYYLFGGLVTGRYVVVEEDPFGYTSTGDIDGTNDNRIGVALLTNNDMSGRDFFDWSLSGLTIVKLVGADDIVVPGEIFPYSILVSNTRAVAAAQVRIVDHLPAGLDVLPGSERLYVSGAIISNAAIDYFQAAAYTNSNGNTAWNGPWIEDADDQSPTGGDIAVETDLGSLRLRIRDDNQSISRSANIHGGTSAQLRYSYRRAGVEADEYVSVEISTNNATPWHELARHGHQVGGAASQSDGSYKAMSIDITAYASTNTTIRFRSPAGVMTDGDMVFFDDIRLDFQFSEIIATNAAPPPELAAGLTLQPYAFASVTFTVQVTTADWLVNTGIVYTLTDTNGQFATVTNLVGDITMTQGMVVVCAEGRQGVKLGWTAYTNEQGVVMKEYDILYADDPSGFHAGLSNKWACLSSLAACTSVDTGGVNRCAPEQLGTGLRFYRTSFRGAWSTNRTTRFATKEVYLAKAIALAEGENFISLMMVPDDNRLISVLGNDRLPAGENLATATRLEWYATTAQSEATNIVWLSTAGIWQHEAGGSANDLAIPLNQGFNLILPPGSGDRTLVVAGRLPTNACAEAGHVVPIIGNQAFNVLSYNLPYRVKLKDSGLKQAGFTGVAPGKSFNPINSDELRILRRGGGSMQTPLYRILLNSEGNFQYWSGGNGLADDLMLDPDWALLIYTKKTVSNLNWQVTLPYANPTCEMAP